MPTEGESRPVAIVLDTNVILSGLNYSGSPSRLLRLLLQGEQAWSVSPFILQELYRILTEKFKWEEPRVQQALRHIREVAMEVDPPRSVSVIREKDDDNRILECAIFVKADYLVTGDRRHLLPLREFQGVSIVSPAEFLELLFRHRVGR